jgi:hypothetical protein
MSNTETTRSDLVATMTDLTELVDDTVNRLADEFGDGWTIQFIAFVATLTDAEFEALSPMIQFVIIAVGDRVLRGVA